MKVYKINMFKDKNDYKNIIDSKGLEKTASSLKYINDDNDIVINCDNLLELSKSNKGEDEELPIIRDMLEDKYRETKEGRFKKN